MSVDTKPGQGHGKEHRGGREGTGGNALKKLEKGDERRTPKKDTRRG